jgi:hypothetical protein
VIDHHHVGPAAVAQGRQAVFDLDGVVLGGRLYTVEARAPKGKVDDDAKAAAKAVAATLYRPEGAPAGPPEGAATPADGEPAAAE